MNPILQGVRLSTVRRITSFEKRYPKMKPHALSMIKLCLKLEPKERLGCDVLMEEEFFSHDSELIPKFKKKLSTQMYNEIKYNVLIQKLGIKPAEYPVLRKPEPRSPLARRTRRGRGRERRIEASERV